MNITTKQLLDCSVQLQLNSKDPVTLAFFLDGRSYSIASPVVKDYLARLIELINLQLEQNKHDHLLSNIPSMGYVEPEDL